MQFNTMLLRFNHKALIFSFLNYYTFSAFYGVSEQHEWIRFIGLLCFCC